MSEMSGENVESDATEQHVNRVFLPLEHACSVSVCLSFEKKKYIFRNVFSRRWDIAGTAECLLACVRSCI